MTNRSLTEETISHVNSMKRLLYESALVLEDYGVVISERTLNGIIDESKSTVGIANPKSLCGMKLYIGNKQCDDLIYLTPKSHLDLHPEWYKPCEEES
jgi:hypothetical protein